MGCIIIIGSDHDHCCDLVQEHLSRRGYDVFRLNEVDLFPGLAFAWELCRGGFRGAIRSANRQAAFGDIQAVLARFYGVPVSPEAYHTKDGQYISSEWHALAQGWMHGLTCPIVNRLRLELWYRSRLNVPDLVSVIPNGAFRLPRPIITTSVDDAKAFFDRVSLKARYSPMSQASHYGIADEADFEKLTTLHGVLPFHLMEVVDGEDIEAFVIGQDVSCVTATGHARETEAHVRKRCVQIAATLGLSFCQIQLTKARTGEWYCTGVECMPHLLGCEPDVADTVSQRLAGFLAHDARARA